MSVATRLRELLPAPLTAAPDSVLVQLLDVAALEIEAVHEDVERVRQTHWIRTTRRVEEAEKLGALLGIPRLQGESLALYRERLLAMAVARLQGATGPVQIRRFVFDYLNAAEKALGASLVAGLRGTPFEEAYQGSPGRRAFRPLALEENAPLRRTSAVLAARGNLVPYLLRWRETNRGLEHAVAEVDLRGLFGARTAVPVIANVTTGQLIGYRGVVRFGQRLQIRPSSAQPGARDAVALLDGQDASGKLFSLSNFRQGVPFTPEQLDATPLLPAVVRGPNDWVYLQLAHFDVRGLDHAFLSLAGPQLREALFNETSFDEALFPSGPLAWMSLAWTETEPAAFEVRVPRTVVLEPADADLPEPPRTVVDRGLLDSVRRLHAAGVRASLRVAPMLERQPMHERFELPWRVFDPERGPSGIDGGATLGGKFGETRIGSSRFE